VNYFFRIEYFDDMASSADGTPVDESGGYEPAAIAHKNLHVEGVQLFYDEIGERRSPPQTSSSSEGSPSQVRYRSHNNTIITWLSS